LHHCAKYHLDILNSCGNVAIFSKWRTSAILHFLKFKFSSSVLIGYRPALFKQVTMRYSTFYLFFGGSAGNRLYRPLLFFGVWPLNVKRYERDPNRYVLGRSDVMWRINSQNRSMHVEERREQKNTQKERKKLDIYCHVCARYFACSRLVCNNSVRLS